jgi:hypothetical protein
MSTEQIRAVGCGPILAILSAIVASVVFRWQVQRWSHWVPTKVGEKGKKQLLQENKDTIRIAKALSFFGFCVGCFFYVTGRMSKYDWRGLGVGGGLACFLPILYIIVKNITQGNEKMKEAFVAFVIDQKTPTKVLFAFMGVCLVGGVVSVVSLLHEL